MIFKRDRLEYEFLPAALELEQTPASPLGRIVIWTMLVLILTVGVWSYLGKIDIVAVARGKIIPDGRIKVIQPTEEGSIRNILVEEGQKVKQGDVLIELDSTIKEADLENVKIELAVARLEKEILQAELIGQDVQVVSTYQSRFPEVSPEVLQFEQKLEEAREAQYGARSDSLMFVISQKKKEIETEEINLLNLEKKYELLVFQSKSKSSEVLESDEEILSSKVGLFTAENEIEAQKSKLQQTKDALREAEENLQSLKKERETTLLNNLVEIEKKISAYGGEVTKAKKLSDLQRLTSPVNGTAHGLSSYTIGGVVTPAQPVLTIVPEGTALIVEANVRNQDIGFIQLGQNAEVKLDTFPFQKYGTLKGIVAFISPDAFEDETQGLIYKIKIKLEQENIQVDGRTVHVSPGMAVSAEVKTGKRRIIEFFLSPIIKYAKEGLSLR